MSGRGARRGEEALSSAARIGVTLLLLLLAACSESSGRGGPQVSRDVVAHLERRYGESFEVLHTSNESHAGVGWVSRYRFRARPTANPTLEFGGSIGYSEGRPIVRDDYACDGVARWLPARLTRQPTRPVEVTRAVVRCSSALPAHPAPDEPLPEGSVTAELALDVFDDGPAHATLAETAASVRTSASALGVRVIGGADLYPARLRPLRERADTTVVAGRRTLESLVGFRRATVDLESALVTERPRLTGVEAQVVEALRRAVPTAQVEVRVTPVTALEVAAPAELRLETLPPRSVLHADLRVAGLASIAGDVPRLRDALARSRRTGGSFG